MIVAILAFGYYSKLNFRIQDKLDIKAKMDDIPVLDDVILAFQAQPAFLLSHGQRTGVDQIVIMDNFGADEAALKIGVNLARSLRRLRAPADGPGAHLLLSSRKKGG